MEEACFVRKGRARGEGRKRSGFCKGENCNCGINLLHTSKDGSTFVTKFVGMNVRCWNAERDVARKGGGRFNRGKISCFLS